MKGHVKVLKRTRSAGAATTPLSGMSHTPPRSEADLDESGAFLCPSFYVFVIIDPHSALARECLATVLIFHVVFMVVVDGVAPSCSVHPLASKLCISFPSDDLHILRPLCPVLPCTCCSTSTAPSACALHLYTPAP